MDTRELAATMQTIAGPDVAAELGWIAPSDDSLGSYAEIVVDALQLAGGADPAAIEPIILRAAARVALWRAVMEQTVAHYDVTPPDGVRMVRQKMHEHARGMYRVARSEAQAVGVPGLAVPSIALRQVIQRRIGGAPLVEPEFG